MDGMSKALGLPTPAQSGTPGTVTGLGLGPRDTGFDSPVPDEKCASRKEIGWMAKLS